MNNFTVLILPWRIASLFKYSFIALSPFFAGGYVAVWVSGGGEEDGGEGTFLKKDSWKRNLREAFVWGTENFMHCYIKTFRLFKCFVLPFYALIIGLNLICLVSVRKPGKCLHLSCCCCF